jgi:hypothetical protein
MVDIVIAYSSLQKYSQDVWSQNRARRAMYSSKKRREDVFFPHLRLSVLFRTLLTFMCMTLVILVVSSLTQIVLYLGRIIVPETFCRYEIRVPYIVRLED